MYIHIYVYDMHWVQRLYSVIVEKLMESSKGNQMETGISITGNSQAA